MKRILITFFLVVGLSIVSSPSGAYSVYTSGPLDSLNIDFYIDNDGPGEIFSVTYDLTATGLIIDPFPFDITVPAGGSATYFDNDPLFTVFGFNLTSFDVGDEFSFGWDPDKAGNPFYGAEIVELVGTSVTLVTSLGTLYGTMFIDPTQDHLFVNFSVPEPATMLLLGLGLLGLWGFRKKFKK